ncbi:MAG: metallopeptidase family protein [Alphaproteobacteria bacterium]|nr:metallopeptidase family protein [Alphaproteobacteria bacterium]
MNQQIVLNFSTPPSSDDLTVMANQIMEELPDELVEQTEELTVEIEELPDEATEADLELEDPYDLLVYYKAGKQLAPGVESKQADADDVLVLYRRSILDLWCERGEDLTHIIREAMIEEIAGYFEFPEEDIDGMLLRYAA